MSLKQRLVHARSQAGVAEANVRGAVRSASGIDRSDSAMVGANGEINAHSKQELLERIAGIVDLIGEGSIQPQMAQEVDARYEEQVGSIVQAAMEDRTHETGGGFYVMGETLGDAVWETTGRLGFTSKFLLRHEVPRGQEGRIRVRQQNVVSWIITRESMVPRSIIRQNWVYPEMVTIATWTTIDDTERAMSPVELMDEKYTEMLQSTMVREDTLTRWLFTQAAPVFNDVFTFAELTPALFSSMQIQVQRWGLSCPSCLVAIDLWNDIRTNSDFLSAYEPVSKLTLIEEGRLGKLYDTEIYTDGLRYETLQVLQEGEMFFLAEPQGLGGYVEYMPLQTRPSDMHHVGVGAEGWYSHMTRGYSVTNSRGVVWGFRSS